MSERGTRKNNVRTNQRDEHEKNRVYEKKGDSTLARKCKASQKHFSPKNKNPSANISVGVYQRSKYMKWLEACEKKKNVKAGARKPTALFSVHSIESYNNTACTEDKAKKALSAMWMSLM